MSNAQDAQDAQDAQENVLIGREYKVLDHGWVRVVDLMGDDAAICQAARNSYGKGTKSSRDDALLLHYLIKHVHTSPLEMAEIKLHICMPIFVARQLIRHRTASTSEVSLRYSEAEEIFYVPEAEDIGAQSVVNKQGRDGEAMPHVQDVQAIIESNSQRAYDSYNKLLHGDKHRPGIARELARLALPVNFYTQWYWKIDVNNFLKVIKLRMDPHAQKEIQYYAQIFWKILQEWLPLTAAAFEDIELNGVRFTGGQIKLLVELINGCHVGATEAELKTLYPQVSKRDILEVLQFVHKHELGS